MPIFKSLQISTSASSIKDHILHLVLTVLISFQHMYFSASLIFQDAEIFRVQNNLGLFSD